MIYLQTISLQTDDESVVNITRSGTTFTATRKNGTTFTFTQQDNNTNTVYVCQNASASVSALSADGWKSITVNVPAKSGYTPFLILYGGTGSYSAQACSAPARIISSTGNQSFIIHNCSGMAVNAYNVTFVIMYRSN